MHHRVYQVLDVFHDFLRVEDTNLEPILEPKNGIVANFFLGSKTPLVDSILEPIFGF